MKTALQSIPVVAAAPLLSACASSGGAMADAASAPQPGATILTDIEYGSGIERGARDRGVRVQWVNPPSRRVPLAVR